MHVSSTGPNSLIFHKNEEAYLAVETSLAVLKDNKLTRLVEETVATVTVPAGTRQFIAGDRRSVVQADHEGRGLNLLQQFLVLGMSSNQGLTILKEMGYCQSVIMIGVQTHILEGKKLTSVQLSRFSVVKTPMGRALEPRASSMMREN